jgi:predicted RNase H-like nuclease (RuvC/YqgF family)
MLDGTTSVPEDEEEVAAARAAELRQWKHCVCDLHRVLSVAQGMFLLLEQNNEALLRVAIEIVCDNTASAVLWWTEEWYDDEQRRTYFRQMVNGFLAKCMAAMNVEVEEDTDRMDELNAELEKAKERASLAEASRDAMERSKMNMETMINDLQAKLKESEDREKEMKSANERLVEQLKNQAPKDDGPDESLRNQIKQL